LGVSCRAGDRHAAPHEPGVLCGARGERWALVIVSTTGLAAPRAGNANYLAAKAAAEAWTQALGHELAKTGGGADILRVLALFSDADREASPEKDFGAWTHVDVLGGRIVAALA
jgi:3-oxoacyl-[acyl-carrier protein] reductase